MQTPDLSVKMYLYEIKIGHLRVRVVTVRKLSKLNKQLCVLFMLDLQELHRTNEPKAEQICTTCLGYMAQTIYMLGPEPWAALDHATPL